MSSGVVGTKRSIATTWVVLTALAAVFRSEDPSQSAPPGSGGVDQATNAFDPWRVRKEALTDIVEIVLRQPAIAWTEKANALVLAYLEQAFPCGTTAPRSAELGEGVARIMARLEETPPQTNQVAAQSEDKALVPRSFESLYGRAAARVHEVLRCVNAVAREGGWSGDWNARQWQEQVWEDPWTFDVNTPGAIGPVALASMEHVVASIKGGLAEDNHPGIRRRLLASCRKLIGASPAADAALRDAARTCVARLNKEEKSKNWKDRQGLYWDIAAYCHGTGMVDELPSDEIGRALRLLQFTLTHESAVPAISIQSMTLVEAEAGESAPINVDGVVALVWFQENIVYGFELEDGRYIELDIRRLEEKKTPLASVKIAIEGEAQAWKRLRCMWNDLAPPTFEQL